MGRTVHQIKVTLRGTRPPIWRRIVVYSDTTLFELHEVLQISMGWMDSHLHQYRKRNTYYGKPNDEFGVRRINEKKVRLNEVLQHEKDRMVYEYDFGDGWEHDLVLEKIEIAQEGMKYPTVLKGKGACPPEDVGGVFGYYDFLDTISNTEHPEHKNMIDWCGEFDPNELDIEEANAYFHGIKKDA